MHDDADRAAGLPSVAVSADGTAGLQAAKILLTWAMSKTVGSFSGTAPAAGHACRL
jgi:hypothetical protein